jgi:hypothetical protein
MDFSPSIQFIRKSGSIFDIESSFMAGAIDCLEKLRQPYGRWVSADGPSQDPGTTLDALRAIWLSKEQDIK